MHKIFIYHHTDMDGLCAGRMIYEHAIGLPEVYDEIIVRPINYTDAFDFSGIEDDTESEISVYIVDFHIKPEVMKRLLACDVYVTMIDHHKTCIADYKDWDWENNKFDHVFVEDGISGCELSWFWMNNYEDDYMSRLKSDRSPIASVEEIREFIDKNAPHYIKYAGDYDTWQFRFGSSGKSLNNFINSYPDLTINEWSDLWDELGDYVTLLEVLSEGGAIERYKEAERIATLKKAYEYIWDEEADITALVVNTKSDSALFDTVIDGEAIIKKYSFGVMWQYDGASGKYVYSLRSRGDFDVSIIAKEFGGGGHKKASGFSVAGDADFKPFIDGAVY